VGGAVNQPAVFAQLGDDRLVIFVKFVRQFTD